MTNQFTAENPDEIRFTVTLTYPLKTWRNIVNALARDPSDYRMDELERDIRSMIRQAEKVYYPESEQK